jgi:hypothetical protein
MTSPAKAAANAANAHLSTGPRTEAGKDISSRNAVKHGLTSRQFVVPEDQREAFDQLRDALLAEIDPQGALEMTTFDQLLHCAWNLQRFRSLEAGLMTGDLDPLLDESAAKTLDRLYRYRGAAERGYYRAVKELRTLQTARTMRRQLDEKQAEQLPALVSLKDLTKRTHAALMQESTMMRIEAIERKGAALLTRYRQNQAAAAENGESNGA